MYKNQQKIIADIEICHKTLKKLISGGFEIAFEHIGRIIWGDSFNNLNYNYFKNKGFYLIFGYACLWTAKSICNLELEDLKRALEYLDQAKRNARR